MVVEFDFDGVGSDKRIQKLIKKMISNKNEIWIITMRRENNFNKHVLAPVLKSVGLTEYNVIYCNDKPKTEMIEMINADLYIDNNDFEFDSILNHTNCLPFLFKN